MQTGEDDGDGKRPRYGKEQVRRETFFLLFLLVVVVGVVMDELLSLVLLLFLMGPTCDRGLNSDWCPMHPAQAERFMTKFRALPMDALSDAQVLAAVGQLTAELDTSAC